MRWIHFSRSGEKKEIVTFGEIMGRIEVEHEYRFEQALPGLVRITFAGAEANVAASLAYMGREAQFVTALPKNPISRSCLAYLHSLGVKTDHVILSDEGRMGLYFLETGANQRPSNVIYDRDFSSVGLYDSKGYDWHSIFSDCTCMMSPADWTELHEALRWTTLRGRGVHDEAEVRRAVQGEGSA